MSDLISRQAAIKEIIETYEYEFPTASGAFDEFATKIVPNVLKNLPSAQTEPCGDVPDNNVGECEDAVSRADAISVLDNFTQTDTLGHTPRQIVEALPSAQQDYDLSGYSDRLWKAAYERGKAEAQRTGRWIDGKVKHIKNGELRNVRECSECGSSYFVYDYYNSVDEIPKFCPNCGARMEVETE